MFVFFFFFWGGGGGGGGELTVCVPDYSKTNEYILCFYVGGDQMKKKGGGGGLRLRQGLSDKLMSPNMYECFMNTEYLCACLKKITTNLSLKQLLNYCINQIRDVVLK